MSETVIETETKKVSWLELGWSAASLVMLLLGAIGIIYGWGYRGLGEDILVPSFVALILACFAEIRSIGARLE